ncbi:hypothetical protein CEE34_01800 [Candidatus Aerophobetes bacterium Ae_b3a]|nr:MAG: hypothetical protein CEE34_01800 [Candidatus Aerophobetes bacterium Ae_b3a]
MSEDFWKSCKLQYLILITFLVLAGLAGGLVVSLPCRAEISSLGEKPVSMDFRDTDLKDAIGMLSVMTGWNMVVDKDVEGRVNVRFQDVPGLQILSEILEINECQYEIQDNIIKVSRMPIITQRLPLEYALVSSVAPYLDALISSEGSFQLDEATNTIVVSDKKKNLEKITVFLQQIDTPAEQLQSKSFTIRFIPVDSVVFLLEDYLSAEGKIKIDPLANTLLLTETSRNFVQLEKLLLNIDVYRAIEEMFTLRYALASSVAPLLENYLGPEDKLQVNEQANEIILSSDLYTLKKIGALLDSLDTPAKQLQSKSFTVKYLYLEELASIVEENLSSLGEIIERNQARSTFVVEDTSYNLSKIEKVIKEADVFIPLKKTYEIKFAPLSSLAEQIEDILSEEGKKSLETREETDTIAVKDVKKNLDRIDKLISAKDTLEAQLITKRYVLKYLSAIEAKYYLEVNNMVSDDGEIRVPVVREKVEAGNVKDQSEYIIIPQETVGNPKEIKVESAQVDLPEEEENVIYITDLKRNISKIDEAIEEMNSPSRAEEIINRTFYIREGSLERIALAMANILGIEPDNIEGLEPKGEWMQMEVPTLEINLGTVGPR